jgi:predicted acyltransferase (DUF342 family)
MLLTNARDLHARIRSRLDAPESGFALITVIGIMAITVIIAMAITGSAINAVSFTTSTRAGVQARATADAGIDTAWVSMSKGAFTCAGSGSLEGGSYSTTTSYFAASGTALSCVGGVASGVPAKAVVNARGVAANAGVAGGSSGNERNLTALFDIVVDPGTVVLDEVVFTEGDMHLNNNVNFTDTTGKANLYSNSNISCAANDPKVQGSVYVQGNFTAPNQCKVSGTVWAGGEVSLSSQVSVQGDVYSAGGAPGGSASINLGTAFVAGSVVANGDVVLNGNSNQQYCPLNGYNAKVCGSIVSLESTISIGNGGKVGGGLYARGNVDLGTTNSERIVGGNVVSNAGSLQASNYGNSGYRVGGYVAVRGTSDLPKERIGNAASSCSASAGFVACNPVNPATPMAAIPAALNFPTNTRVVAPPRQSLPRINMYPDSALAAKWAGWTVQHVACAAAKATIAAGHSGKLLLVVDGCTSPIEWENTTISLKGDLAIMSPAGFNTRNDNTINSTVAGVKHNLLWIVPSDATLASGANLATWTAPIATDPSYTKPSCPSGAFGDININKLRITDVKTFMYTPCDLIMSNEIVGFTGQMYSGTSAMPSNSTFVMEQMSVPGATAGAGGTATVTATQTARFDARDAR